MNIEKVIFLLRGYKIILDSDLASFYGVPTKQLNRSVQRHLDRFPADFMFQLSPEEVANLNLQRQSHGGKTTLPYAFTENGIAMLSSVLHSPQAIQVNIAIMRIFTQMRGQKNYEQEIKTEVKQLKEDSNRLFKIVFERLDTLEEKTDPETPPLRKRIGLK